MCYNPYTLEGKTILVTGASSGIGRAVAIECSKLQAQVILTGRNEQRLNQTVAMLSHPEKGHLAVIADLATDDGIEQLIAALPPIDGCSMNAGISKNVPLQFIKRETLTEVLEINTISQIMLTKQLVKAKKVRRGGSIVFTASVSGNQTVTPAHCIYSTSKSALVGFMKNAAIDLAPKGIRCNTVNPGMVETDMIRNGNYTDQQLKDNANEYPLKRFGKPEEIALSITFLLSDASSWITGQSLVIDGGLTLK